VPTVTQETAALHARRARRRRLAVLVARTGLGLLVPLAVAGVLAHGAPARQRAVARPRSRPVAPRPSPNLAPGSDPSALPGDVLIADEGNDRLLLVSRTGQVVWQFPPPGASARLASPDDAFFARGGRSIIVTEEAAQVVSLLDVRQRRLTWRYGRLGDSGAGPNRLSNPDDAMVLPGNHVLIADIRNCSLLLTRIGAHTPLERLGAADRGCLHAPPLRFGSPNGAFPLPRGEELVTEINGDWVDALDLAGRVRWSTHPPGVSYPSDTNEVAPGRYVTADYSTPGQVVEFDRHGNLLWRYGPRSGPGMLRNPSLCEPVPSSGDFLCNDDGNDRVVVIDPRSNRIVWQYGHDGVPGRRPGYLDEPDGVDLAPPYSLLEREASWLPTPTLRCAPGLPPGACTIFAPANGAHR